MPGNVTFADGGNSQSFTFTAAGDEADDDGESVVISFGSSMPDRVGAGSTGQTTVSITDNDGPEPEPEPTPTPQPQQPVTDSAAALDGDVDLGDITGVEKTLFPSHVIEGDDDQVD